MGAGPLLDLSYAYDPVGNVASITDAADLGAEQVFAYDELDRLVGVSGVYTRAYAYDEVGNIVESNGRAYLYEGSGHTHVQPHAVTQAGSDAYTYDANGNMETGAGRALTWDAENRLKQANVDGQVVVYAYDGDGALVMKEVGAQATVYIGAHYELDVESGPETRYYFLNGRRVAMQKGGAVAYVHSDHPSTLLRAGLGSTSAVSDEAGDPVGDTVRYFPYGAERTGSPGTLPTDYLFPSTDTGQATEQRREDSLHGLHQVEARVYDRSLDRWFSAAAMHRSQGIRRR